jgi:cysteine desulfurase
MRTISYFDHAATTPLDERVLDAMVPFLRDHWGNPSSVYAHGRAARRGLDEARDSTAESLRCRPNEVVFTGSGTESDNLGIIGAALARRGDGDHVVTSTIEHHAVHHACDWLERAHGFRVTRVPVDAHGVIDVDAFASAIQDRAVLATVMLANNEIGTIQPIEHLSELAHAHGALLHCDAVQAAGTLDIDVSRLGADLVSLSGHKFYGPKGVGALYIRRGTRVVPTVHGGGQERGLRSGTENVALAVGFAVALRLSREELPGRVCQARRQRDRIIQSTLTSIPGARLTGHPTERLPNNASFVFEDADGESILMNLDQHGICASSGSACTSGSLEISHVLKAIGLPDRVARGSLRLSTGRACSDAEVEQLCELLPGVIAHVRSVMPSLIATRD